MSEQEKAIANVPTPGPLMDMNDPAMAEMLALAYGGFKTDGPPPIGQIVLINSGKQIGKYNLNPKTDNGKWYDTATGKTYDTLENVIVMKAVTNGDWSDKYHPTENPEPKTFCRSYDRVRPLPEYAEARAQEQGVAKEVASCDNCKHKVWKNSADGTRVPPNCGEGYKLILWMEDGSPRVYYTKKSAARSAKKFVQSYQARRIPTFFWKVNLGTEFVTDKHDNSYFEPRFVSTVQVTKDELGTVAAWLKDFSADFERRANEVHMDDEDGIPDGPVINTTAKAAVDPEADIFED